MIQSAIFTTCKAKLDRVICEAYVCSNAHDKYAHCHGSIEHLSWYITQPIF